MRTEVKVSPFELEVRGFDLHEEGWIGTLLTLANGRIGVRGVLEIAGLRDNYVFMSGFYNDVPIWRREIVVLPSVTGVYINNTSMLDIQSAMRKLDMKNGLLKTQVVLGKNIKYNSEILAHKGRRDLVMQKVRVESEADLEVSLPVENPLNPFLYGYTYTEHLVRTGHVFDENSVNVYYNLRDTRAGLRVRMLLKPRQGSIVGKYVAKDAIGFVLKGNDIEIERYALLLKDKGKRAAEVDANSLNWDELVNEHFSRWREAWNYVGLEVGGDEFLAGAITFYTFHLLQLIDEDAEEWMIPARGLHGVGYRGHVFWDSDVYLLPFLSFIYPSSMKKMLNYRCKALDAAMKYARQTGFHGARYPWESVDDGYESTPRYYPVNLSDCECVDIPTGEQEIHISADVAFAIDVYVKATGDTDFLKKCGLKLLTEIARYWASRVEYDFSKKSYVIKGVIGPDEYHVNVDNNHYTNYLASHALKTASHYALQALNNKDLGIVIEDLRLTEDEMKEWLKIADQIYINRVVNDIIEEFEGYFDLEDIDIEKQGIHRVDFRKLSEVAKTKLVKQADVVLALVLREFIEGLNMETLKKNYEYYLKRTTHESSLSLPIYTTAALIINSADADYLLKETLKTDLENIYGNTQEGFHVATAGGIWYAILIGLLGLRIRNNELIFNPRKLDLLKIAIKVKYRGKSIGLETG